MSGVRLDSQYRDKQDHTPEHTATIFRWWAMHYDSIFSPVTAGHLRSAADLLDRITEYLATSNKEVN